MLLCYAVLCWAVLLTLPPCSRLQHACRLPCANTSSRVASIARQKISQLGCNLDDLPSPSRPRRRVLQSSGAPKMLNTRPALGDSKSASKSVSSDVLDPRLRALLPSGQKDPSRLGSRAALLAGRALVRPTQQKQLITLRLSRDVAISQDPVVAA